MHIESKRSIFSRNTQCSQFTRFRLVMAFIKLSLFLSLFISAFIELPLLVVAWCQFFFPLYPFDLKSSAIAVWVRECNSCGKDTKYIFASATDCCCCCCFFVVLCIDMSIPAFVSSFTWLFDFFAWFSTFRYTTFFCLCVVFGLCVHNMLEREWKHRSICYLSTERLASLWLPHHLTSWTERE